MARLFARASSMKLQKVGAILTAAPMTLCCWFRLASNSLTDNLLGMWAAADSQSFNLEISNTNKIVNKIRDGVAGTIRATGATTITNGIWYHGCAVYTSATDRAVYLNGASEATSVTSVTPAGLDTSGVGVLNGTGFFDGRIADAAIWNAALSANEIAALAAGVSPLRIRRLSLAAFWPLYGYQSPEQDLVGANSLTLTNSPTAAGGPPSIRIRRA